MPVPSAAFPCCRAHDLFAPVEDYPKSILRMLGDEVYWFHWDSSFDGNATIRVAKLGAEATVCRIYRASAFGKVRHHRALLRHADWAQLEDAVVAANFWMLDEHGGRHGLDGSTWRLAGRRRHEYHSVSRWSPDGAVRDLGRVNRGPTGSAWGPQRRVPAVTAVNFGYKSLKRLARPRGVEPLTPRSVVWCSIQLSYGRINGLAPSPSPSSAWHRHGRGWDPL